MFRLVVDSRFTEKEENFFRLLVTYQKEKNTNFKQKLVPPRKNKKQNQQDQFHHSWNSKMYNNGLGIPTQSPNIDPSGILMMSQST